MSITINHILIRPLDLEGMIRFFEQALGLKNGHRPPFPFPGAWLWSNDAPLIHLSEGNPADDSQTEYLGNQATVPHAGTGMIDHIAFSGSDYPELIERLKRHQLDYFERSVPLTGEHQVFVSGPEGIRIEVQFKSNAVLPAGGKQ